MSEMEEITNEIFNLYISKNEADVKASLDYTMKRDIDDLIPSTFQVMNVLRSRNVLCDVVLKAEEQRFPCHKLVLTARIPYFQAMFSSNMKETTEKEIEMHDVEAASLKCIVTYAYTGHINDYDGVNLFYLLATASYMDIKEITRITLKKLNSKKLVDLDNIFKVKEFAEAMECVELLEFCRVFIEDNLEDISELQKFSELSKSELIDFLKRDTMPVREQTVFEVAMKWLNHDPGRHAEQADVLNHVRLPLICNKILGRSLKTLKLSDDAREIVQSGMDAKLLNLQDQIDSYPLTTPRAHSHGAIYFMGGVWNGCGKNKNTYSYRKGVVTYDPIYRYWNSIKPMIKEREMFGAAVFADLVFIMGGRRHFNYRKSVEYYNPFSEKWRTLAPMKQENCNIGVCTLSGHIYSCGGDHYGSTLSTVEFYCPVYNYWKTCDQMNEARECAGVVSLYGSLWVIGGGQNTSHTSHRGRQIGSRYLNTMERHDPREGKWHYEKPLMQKRSAFGCTTLFDKIYAAGGFDGVEYLNTVEVYDPRNQKWSSETPMDIGKHKLGLLTIKNKLYTVGGADEELIFNNVDMYDTSEKIWKRITKLKHYGVDFSAVVMPYD